jgi:hypothetical protein
MFKQRLLLALAVAGLSVGTALSALNAGRLFSTASTETATFECTGGGSESFTNIPASSSAYSTRTWTGDNGVAWSATDARTDQTLTGKAIALRTSTLKNTAPVAGGIGTLSFKYKRVFTGNSTLKVYVNGVQVGSDITVSSETAATFSQVVNVPGNVNIEIRNSLNRTIVDDVQWTCYSEPVTGPELQLANSNNTNVNCGELTLEYGSQSVDVYTDAVFSIKNTGTSVLNVSSLSLTNSTDFQIISPSGAFTVPASGTAIVLVRFDAASAGAKTSTLTINSDDANEAECTVELTGTGLATCISPIVFEATIAVDSIAPTTADVTIGNVTADGYLAIVSETSPLTSLPVDGVNYVVGDSIGGGVVAYNGSNADFALANLTENTDYFLFVYAYNNVDCFEGPKFDTRTAITESFSTPVAPCIGGAETFTNMPANSSAYATRTWTGDNGLAWSATDARTDQTLTGRAIALRTGTLTNTVPATGGIGTLSFNYKRVFTGGSTLKVFVNGIQYGGDIAVTSDSVMVYSQPIDVAGDITVEIRNSGNRTIIDDVNWNCYQVPNRPEIQLLDGELAPKACGNFNVNLGNVQAGIDTDYVFVINNNGTQDLEISDLILSDTINYTVISPDTFPVVVDSLGAVDVTVRFNSATTGSKPATLDILSNDADEATCTVNFAAVAQEICAAPAVTTGTLDITNVTSSSADVEVAGVTANGYIAVLATTGTISAPVNGTMYEAGDLLGDGVVAYAGTDALFTLSDLEPATTYTLYVYAYNNEGCLEGPAYSAELSDEIVTEEAPCVGGNETFANMPASASSYATRNWTGDNGIAWTATDSRTDQTLNGRAVAVRTGYVQNTTAATSGVGTLSFNYKRVFTGNSTLKVFVNGVQVGTDITVSSDTAVQFSEVVNVSGNATIRIENSGNRTIIDDIQWTCYSGTAKPAAVQVKNVEVKEVNLYPNPNNGQFQVSLPEGTDSASVEVYNLAGKLVLSKKAANNEVINLGNAEKGMYMVTVRSGNTVANKKVIVN